MRVISTEGSRPIHLWTEDIEAEAMRQLQNIAKLKFIDAHGVAVMPDVHYGIGATVGSVIATQGAIIPAAVGVDIGCGMAAVRTSLKASDLPDSLAAIRSSIERGVPVGFAKHTKDEKLDSLRSSVPLMPSDTMNLIYHVLKVKDNGKELMAQLGTLGGGNHFIEICLDENQDVWIMLHSGSRGIGNKIGRHFIELAKREMERWMIHLPDTDLAYLPEGSEHFGAYVAAVRWAQEYAATNRRVMLEEVIRNLAHHTKPFELTEEAIYCHHNYISRENHFGRNLWITRKGAIRARKGDLGIIPGSMGARSFIVSGLGSAASYCSCSHGAGRRMSRTAAGKRFSLADVAAQTEGVECRKDKGVIDEIPGAYKDIDQVMANQADLVEVRHTLKQVLCVKG